MKKFKPPGREALQVHYKKQKLYEQRMKLHWVSEDVVKGMKWLSQIVGSFVATSEWGSSRKREDVVMVGGILPPMPAAATEHRAHLATWRCCMPN